MTPNTQLKAAQAKRDRIEALVCERLGFPMPANRTPSFEQRILLEPEGSTLRALDFTIRELTRYAGRIMRQP